MVVPRMATNVARKVGSKLKVGMKVAFSTATASGLAKNAEPI